MGWGGIGYWMSYNDIDIKNGHNFIASLLICRRANFQFNAVMLNELTAIIRKDK